VTPPGAQAPAWTGGPATPPAARSRTSTEKKPASLKAPRTQSFSTLSSNPFLNNNLAGADFCKMIDSKMTENSI